MVDYEGVFSLFCSNLHGHGDVLPGMKFVNLNVEVADERDRLLKVGISKDKDAFIGNGKSLISFYEKYFADPIRAAAIKELSAKLW